MEPDLVYVYRVLAISPQGVSEPSRDVEVSTTAPKEPLLSQPAQVTRFFHNVSEPPGGDFPADDTTTGVAVWGSTVTGNIDDPSDVDWFLLDAQAGLLYQIDLGPEPVMDAADDPELVGIYDASGDLLPRTSNDNLSLSNLDSRVFFSSSEDGAVPRLASIRSSWRMRNASLPLRGTLSAFSLPDWYHPVTVLAVVPIASAASVAVW